MGLKEKGRQSLKAIEKHDLSVHYLTSTGYDVNYKSLKEINISQLNLII